MAFGIKWTNRSVLRFAAGQDPIAAMESKARAAVLEAMDEGWNGPPFDPVRLASRLKLPIEPRPDVSDARTIPTDSGLRIEFNPLRPRGRLRFSIAHEIAHSFFPDCAEAIRNRGGNVEASQDDWQLEILCNIGAAELLMPAGSFPELAECDLGIRNLLNVRKRYDVSTEALLIRTVKLTHHPCAAFCAAFDSSAKRYRLDYLIPSQSWHAKLVAGIHLPNESLVADANAIGFTAAGDETWEKDSSVHVECVGLAPYPGGVVPRVVGLLTRPSARGKKEADIELVLGDALKPRGEGPRIIAHVVPDSTTTWGGGGFAAQVRKRYPRAATEFKAAVAQVGGRLVVGQSYKSHLYGHTYALHMVAQRGHGYEAATRIRYSALARCLDDLQKWAQELRATVHMPKIGTGYGGGDWNVIRELVADALVRKGTRVTVYELP